MIKWEYFDVCVDYREPWTDKLNEMGKQGWEFIHSQEIFRQFRLYFKRVKNEL